MILDYVSNCQVFNSNQTIRANKASCQLVEKIGTSIFNLGVYLGYFKSRFVSVTRAFGFPTQFLLRCLEFSIQPIKMFWVGYGFLKDTASHISPSLQGSSGDGGVEGVEDREVEEMKEWATGSEF